MTSGGKAHGAINMIQRPPLLVFVCGLGLGLAGCSFEGQGQTQGRPVDATLPDGALPAGDAMAGVDAPVAQACVGFVALEVDREPSTSTYLGGGTTAAWLTAEQACEGLGAHLTILDDDNERDAVLRFGGGELWLGASDRVVEGAWLEVTGGVATYLPWIGGSEPSTGAKDDCVSVKAAQEYGRFDAKNCDDKHLYVCECDGRPAVPTAYGL